jgi:spore coat protein U-like protein
MKRITLLAIFAIAAFSNNANAQTNNTQSTANTNASAKLIKVMSVKNADANGLDFGTIVLTTRAALLKWRQQML